MEVVAREEFRNCLGTRPGTRRQQLMETDAHGETNRVSTLAKPVPSLEDLRPAFRQRLRSMYSGEPQPGNNGLVELDKITRISEPRGMWIYETCRRLKPKRSLEIGLAYGFSTIYILAAIDQTGEGHHTALDPFQKDSWHGVGALQAKHLGMEPSFQMLEEFSVATFARFATQKDEFGRILGAEGIAALIR